MTKGLVYKVTSHHFYTGIIDPDWENDPMLKMQMLKEVVEFFFITNFAPKKSLNRDMPFIGQRC